MSVLLARAKRLSETTLTQTCTINRDTHASDGEGGFTNSSTVVAAGVSCRLSVRGGALINADLGQRNERVTSLTEYVLRVATTQDIEPDDEVVIGGETYRVESVWDEHQYAALKRCKVTRI